MEINPVTKEIILKGRAKELDANVKLRNDKGKGVNLNNMSDEAYFLCFIFIF